MSTIVKALGMSIVLGTIFLAACGPVTPQDRARMNKMRQEQAESQDYQVVRLFERDGCTVYSFYDNGRTHYFTNCNGSALGNQSTGGKHPTHYDDEIPTAVN